MEKYDVSYLPCGGKRLEFMREVFIDLQKLPYECIEKISMLRRDFSLIKKMDYEIAQEDFGWFSSYAERKAEDDFYKEGVFQLKLENFIIHIFSDIFNLESDKCVVFFIVHIQK